MKIDYNKYTRADKIFYKPKSFNLNRTNLNLARILSLFRYYLKQMSANTILINKKKLTL